ncbi:collagen binding domain-containing protein [Methanobrevibacter sp.]|uniref:MSCRAMM family protein n=1 Tax=Methanobrevibacter sp. TaxID=66852 RepID=UPI00386B7C98
MLKKRYLILLALMLVICILPQVTASETLDNVTYEDSGDILNQYSLDDAISQTDENDMHLSENGGYGTFADLEYQIVRKYALDLDKDYLFDEEDSDFSYEGIDIKHEIALNGNGHTIYGNTGRIFNVLPGVKEVKISNLIFKISYPPGIKDYNSIFVRDYGGAIYNQGELYLENCTFIDCHANHFGGAVYNSKGKDISLYVNNCTFLNTSVSRVGEIGNFGGAIISYSKLEVNDSRFYDCFARSGGAVYSFNESIISNCHFENNAATICGGAIMNVNTYICEVYNSSFYGNAAEYGGAMYSTIAINCSFAKNTANAKGGNNLYEGVIFNCTCENNDPRNFFGTVNSTGLYVKPGNLVFEKGGLDKSLDFDVLSNPGNEKVSSVWLDIKIADKLNHVSHYSLGSDEYGVVSIPLSDFANGTYKITVSFSNKLYNDSEETYTLNLGILKSTVSFSAGVAFEYGGSGSIFVTVEGGTVEEKNIRVLGQPNARITYANKVITISGLDVGTYTLQVETTPDENHFPTTGTVGINVKKAVAVIKASKLTVVLKKGTLWSVYLIDSKNNKPIANMQLTLQIFTGKKSKFVKVTTNANGVATFKTSGLSKGNHKVIVSATHPGYLFNTVTSSIKVIKPKQLTFKVQKRVNDNNGALISYIVKDKKTNKGINGVKINLLIYTGKKYKVIHLKSKKIKGKKETYNGAFGYSTNELSVGKHKVLIVPASIKYSGSAKTTMVINKIAKKQQAHSLKI